MEKDNKLNSKVYDLVDELETQQIDDNDTGQLADILNDYMTDIQPNFTQDLITEEIDDLQIENNNEIDITVDEREILKQENEDLTLIGNETMLNLHLQDEALRQDLQSTTSRESDNDFIELDLLGDKEEEASEEVKEETAALTEEVVEDSIDLEDLTNEFTHDNLENFNDEEIEDEEQTELDLAILALSQKVKEVKANPEQYTQKTESSDLEELETEIEQTEDLGVTQTLISPTVMDIDSSDLTQEAEIVETTNIDMLADINQEQPQEVLDVKEVDDTNDNLHQMEETIDLESFEQQNNKKEDLQKTIELDALTDEEESEFTKELNNDSKKSTRQFKPFDWFLVIVIVVLTFILIKMLLNR